MALLFMSDGCIVVGATVLAFVSTNRLGVCDFMDGSLVQFFLDYLFDGFCHYNNFNEVS